MQYNVSLSSQRAQGFSAASPRFDYFETELINLYFLQTFLSRTDRTHGAKRTGRKQRDVTQPYIYHTSFRAINVGDTGHRTSILAILA